MEEKYLPIGSVVMLKGGTKRIMITGFLAMESEKKDKIWDYCGCLYPEGVMASNQTGLFDHEQIEKVYYIGLIDEEGEKFKEALNKVEVAIKNINIKE